MGSNLTLKVEPNNIQPDRMTSVYWLFHRGAYFPRVTELSMRRMLALSSKEFRTLLIQSVVPILEDHIPEGDFNSKLEYAPALRNLAVLRGVHATYELRLDKEAKILPLVQSLSLADTYARYYEVRKIRNLFRQKRGSDLVQTSVDKFNSLYGSLWREIADFDREHNLKAIAYRVKVSFKGARVGKEFYTTSEKAANEFLEEVIAPWFTNSLPENPSLSDKFHLMGLDFLKPDLDVDDAEFVRNERAIVAHLRRGSDPNSILDDIKAEEQSQVSVEEAIANMKKAALGQS